MKKLKNMQQSPDIDPCIDAFLDFIKGSDRWAENTYSAYASDLKIWANFVETNQVGWEQLDKDTLSSYQYHLHYTKKLSKRSQVRLLSSLKVFYKFCYQESLTQSQTANHVIMPRYKRSLPKPIVSADMSKLLDSPVKNTNNFLVYRDTALWHLLYSSGMRISEALSLDALDIIQDISLTEKSIADTIKVTGKGNKQRIVFIGSHARVVLQHYLSVRTQHMTVLQHKESALFINKQGGRLTRRGVQYLLKKTLHQKQITKKYTPHSFRHAFATDLLNHGANLRHIQEMLGHTSISTTQNYTYVAIEKLQRVFNQAHPHARKG